MVYTNNRQNQSNKALKGSGGIATLVKYDLFKSFNVSIIYQEEGVLGMKLEDKLSNYSILLYNVYIPPESSTWGRDISTLFNNLISEVFVNIETECIVMCGDFNARTGGEMDYIQNIELITECECLDEHKNGHGEELICFLRDVEFCMLNGRFDKAKI